MSAPTTPSADDNKWAGIGYVGFACCGILPLVMFFLKTDVSPYVKFHWLQSFTLSMSFVVLFILLAFLGSIPGIGFVFHMIGLLLNLVCLVTWIGLIIAGFTGKDIRVPGIADTLQGFIK